MATARLVVGFDLDMTLLDTRPGIAAALRQLSAQTGVPIDADAAVSRLGPPLQQELAHWFPPGAVDAAVTSFRELYPHHAIATSAALPGAAAAVEAVRSAGGRVGVITAKRDDLAVAHLAHVGLVADEVHGLCWQDGKSQALRETGATVYVGDHLADMAAARAAGVTAVGVTTGPCSAQQLREAGADVVLADLTGFPDWLAGHLLGVRLATLDRLLRGLGRVVVAYSGGADSAFLLAAAARALGPGNVVAATAISPSLPASELTAAKRLPRQLGVPHLTPETDELSRDGYRANAGDRCYFCKAELLETLIPLADGATVLTGTNADDAVAGFRPGIRAAEQRGAVAPLRDAGLTKAQVRQASRDWGLSTWDKPAAACLSSRIAYGIPISRERLARVERAEAALRAALDEAGIAVRDLRIRDLGEAGASVEVDAAAVPALTAQPELLAAVEGFPSVVVDPRGFRSGSMNDGLPARFR
ncbi:MAG: ATP-dependent sacrificial sulfur transferase LarE [Micromonosporaceae bacterium]|nr:ATP-dependent sacrificial sulfur transferase LarE [Micromonosporaceae bacterium]